MENKVNLQRIVLAAHAVLAGRVEVELGQFGGGPVLSQGSIGKDLDRGSQILKLGVRNVGDADGQLGGGEHLAGGRDVDGRLVVAVGADGVGFVEDVPVQGAGRAVVGKRYRGAVSWEQGCAVGLVGEDATGEGKEGQREHRFGHGERGTRSES